MIGRRNSSLRVLHIGNVANNAYNIAKALRQHTDIEADCYTNYYTHYISQPEWEDADIGPVHCHDDAPVNWARINLNGFSRPEWYFENRESALKRAFLLSGKDSLRILSFLQHTPTVKEVTEYWRALIERDAQISPHEADKLSELALGKATLGCDIFPTAKAWHEFIKREFQRLCVPPHAPLTTDDFGTDTQKYLSVLFKEYDVIQTYGLTDLFQAILYCPSIPRVTFEHGTMRTFSFKNTAFSRKAMLAYKTSFANIITNADSIHYIKRMGLTQCVFIPHPVDDDKFFPQNNAAFRQTLLDEFGASRLFLALARQNWALKGNDKIVRGFASFIRKVGPGPKLLLGMWGQEIDRTRNLVRELRLDDHVAWIPPLPKRLLARYINASDAVLDQFVLGAFGTTTPEALACGKPVFLYYRQEDHAWCFPEAPPVINVLTADEIADGLKRIYDDPAWAESVGQSGVDWFKRHHSLDIVVRRHADIYKNIQNAPHCVSIPKQYHYASQSITGRVTCIVSCQDASPETIRAYMDGIDGISIPEIMDTRLRGIVRRPRVVLSLNAPCPELEQEAKRLGWTVARGQIPRGILRQLDFSLYKDILETRFIWFCSLDKPFLDKDCVTEWERHFTDSGKIFSGTSNANNPYVPEKIYSRAFVVYRFFLNLLFRSQFDHLQCQSIMVRYGVNIPAPELPPGTALLDMYNYSELAPGLSAQTFRVADL